MLDRPPSTAAARSARERGVSVVELMVCIGIAAVLIGLGVMSIASGRKSGQMASTISAAHTYANALDRFAREHAGRYPTEPGGDDWSNASHAKRAKGPREQVLGTGTARFYLKAPPEAVQDGTVRVIKTPGASPKRATIRYERENSGRGYRLVIKVPGMDACALRGGAFTSETPPDCSRR